MWIEPTKLSAKDMPHYLRGDYKGRKFSVKPVEEVTIPADANMWGGGSREDWYAILLADGTSITLGSTRAPWSVDRKDKAVRLVPDIAVVCHSVFQGKDMGLTFYIHPENMPKFLK